MPIPLIIGAAAAAAKELLPTIIKLAVGVLIAVIVIPMFVISAMIYFPFCCYSLYQKILFHRRSKQLPPCDG